MTRSTTPRTHRALAASALLAFGLMAGALRSAEAAPVINEFSAQVVGADLYEYIEIHGAPNTDYSGLTILEIEGGGLTTLAGVIEGVFQVGTTDANGLWVVNLAANTLENSTLTLLLVSGFSGSLATDLDTDDDGAFDLTPWSAILDSVAVHYGGASDVTYGATVLTVSFDGMPFAPGGASRIPDGTDTDTAADWVRNDFDLAGIPGFAGTPATGEALNTPGAANRLATEPVVVPAPPALALTGLGLVLLAARRQRRKTGDGIA